MEDLEKKWLNFSLVVAHDFWIFVYEWDFLNLYFDFCNCEKKNQEDLKLVADEVQVGS